MIKKIFYIFLIICSVLIVSRQTMALTADEVRAQIEDTNNQIKALDKEIAKYQSQIAETSAQKTTLANLVKELTLTRNKLIKEREQIQKKISATGLLINTLSTDIKEKENIIEISKKSLSQMIKDLNQNDNTPLIERLLAVDSFKDFSREYNNLLTLNQKIRENIIGVSETKQELLSTKIQKEDEQQNLTTLKNSLVQKEQVVTLTKKEKDKILQETKNKEVEYQKLLAEAEKRKNDFEKEMDDYENQLQLLINPKLLPKAGTEVLAWPLNDILITSKYGWRVNPFNSSLNTFHYGVDFRAAVGTKIKAVESGTVVAFGNTDIACKGASFGNWVLVKHNNGLSSTYAHLSVISVKKGQKLMKGDTIGLSGGMKSVFGSGSSTGPHLHLSVYASDGVEVASFESKACPGKILTQPRITRADAHLDPLLYLPKITSEMVKK